MWKTLKEIIGKTKENSTLPTQFMVNNKSVTDKQEIANAFNLYFGNIGKLTCDSVPLSNKPFSDYLTNPTLHSMFLETVDQFSILKLVNKMKPKISFGLDEIPMKVIKESIYNILSPLTHIINRSLLTGIVPDKLKIARIIPIYKAADSKLLKNYRPISLLPAFSKIYEKVMFNKILSYLNSKDILYKHQYGFRPKYSTIYPIIKLLNDCAIAGNSNPNEYVLAVLCDLSKAFDVIDHKLLFKKLEYCGIRGLPKMWIENYLSNRTQYVDIDNTKSLPCSIKCGVPQGSILGPLLYLIYVNDIANSTTSNVLSFADDTTLYMANSNINELYELANIEMNNLYQWFCANKLSLNPTKTKYIIIHSPCKKIETIGLSLNINGVALNRIGNNYKEKSSKFLGIHIDECLSWKFHLHHVNTKISRALFAIRQTKNILPTKSLHTLYHAMVHPHLSYGILAWGKAAKSQLNRTFLLQKRAIRTINRVSYNSHTDPLFKSSEILKLNELHEYESAQFMYKYHTNRLPASFNSMFSYNHELQITHNTRQSHLIHIERCHYSLAARLPRFYLPEIWNNFYQYHDSKSLSVFKKHVKGILLDSYVDKVRCKNLLCKDCY